MNHWFRQWYSWKLFWIKFAHEILRKLSTKNKLFQKLNSCNNPILVYLLIAALYSFSFFFEIVWKCSRCQYESFELFNVPYHPDRFKIFYYRYLKNVKIKFRCIIKVIPQPIKFNKLVFTFIKWLKAVADWHWTASNSFGTLMQTTRNSERF